jgi:hypothetical protein
MLQPHDVVPEHVVLDVFPDFSARLASLSRQIKRPA